jgi:hypothetical protein
MREAKPCYYAYRLVMETRAQTGLVLLAHPDNGEMRFLSPSGLLIRYWHRKEKMRQRGIQL